MPPRRSARPSRPRNIAYPDLPPAPTRRERPNSQNTNGTASGTTLGASSQVIPGTQPSPTRNMGTNSGIMTGENSAPPRPRTPDHLIELRAQRDAATKARHDAEAAQLLREIQESQAIVISSQASTASGSVVNGAAPAMADAASYFNEGMDSRVTPLTADFPAINPMFFKQILENKFDPINISKLCMDVSLVRPTTKSIELKKGIEINTGEDDAGPNDIKGLAHLLRCLGVYWQVKLHFAHTGIRESLSRAFMLYQDRLLRLYTSHTWDSVRLFHLLFHKSRVYQGIDDPGMWRRVDVTLENENLVRREPKPSPGGAYRNNYNANHPLPNESSGARPYPCNRYNSGRDCQDCKYQHICSICQKNHPAKSCNKGPTSNTGGNPNYIPTGRRE